MVANANKNVQGGGSNMTEISMLRGAALRDTGKSPISQLPTSSVMPFKEQHLKQLRAQCLVFLAFRNGLLPKKLHLEIALGNIFPKEDGPRKELGDHKGKEQSLNEPSGVPDVTVSFGRGPIARETERNHQGSSSTGNILEDDSLSKEADNPKVEDKNGPPSDLSVFAEERKHFLPMRRKLEAETQTQEIAESQAFITTASQPDFSSPRGLSVSNRDDDMENGLPHVGRSNQASSAMGINNQMKPEIISWTGIGGHNDVSRGPLPASAVQHESVPERIDNAPSQSQSLGECNVQGNQHADSHLSTFSLREHWKPISGMGNERQPIMPVKDVSALQKHLSQDGCKKATVDETLKNGSPFTVVERSMEQEEVEKSISNDLPPSPKYTTSEKWIMDQQKRKLLLEQNWALKQRKTDQRIATCSNKLKETVSSSEDISAKTKSVIELKKLQLLKLQRRLRSDFLNDFFKPIAANMDRLKSMKKHRHGRRIKQLEKFEQKMKEERQKRIRERQKEFFSEIEVHKERLDDVFKSKRERWRNFNKYVKEFHKRKERIHRERIDRIQREKINLLKINDVEGYLRMVQDAKSDRVNKLLKETEKYLQKLGTKLQAAKALATRFELDMDENRSAGIVEKNETAVENDDESDQAKHYLESNEKYYLMAHSIKESIAEQPSSLLGGKLREYQMNGLRWLVSLYNNHLNGILADEMGLGKTVQVIALICYLMETKNDRGPFLVVVPSSVLPGWESEINFWAPSVNKIVYAGPPEERRRLFKERILQQKFNVLLTTYEYLMNKHDRPKLSKLQWHYIIIDEGHRIKNASCKLNADLKHYQSSHRLLLTGTPLQNNLEELWALLNFLLPNIFNSSEDFSQWFNKPFESNGDNSPDEALLSEEENLLIINRLHQVLRPFVLRRLKHKVENQLPEKIERLVRCEASAYQKLLMKRVEDNLGSLGSSKGRSVHNSVMELRNICNHPYLSQLHADEVDNMMPKHYLPSVVRLCGKLEMLDRLLPKLKATDHRVLFFSTMTRLLDVMEEYLHWKQYRYLRLDGHTSGSDRGALIEKFNQPDSPFFIFLLSIRAGGVGVNLQAADTVIIFDTDWNPQVDLQAQARAHRIGQKRDVLVLRLETVQTVEEQVRAAAEHKLGVANQSITAGFFDNNTSAEDRREYLESLLRECKKEEAAPVLDDDALNDLLARSESEIDIFESVDKQRREGEMETWKKLVGQGKDNSEPVPLPSSRLVTDDDLKPFYEAMKIYEVSKAGTGGISNSGVKRKGEYLGGLDSQQYGRGKRAREVRSYEEQWTEEEFEKMCQADSPDSPKPKEEVVETKLPTDASGSMVAMNNTDPTALPLPQPSVELLPPQPSVVPLPPQPSVVPLPPQPSVVPLPPQPSVVPLPPQPSVVPLPPQPSVEPLPLLSQEVTPPLKRGRGRPKRATPGVSPTAPLLPAPGTVKLEIGSQQGAVSSIPTAAGPHKLPGSAIVTGVSGTVHHVGVGTAPSTQSTTSFPSVTPGSQSAPPSTSVPMQVKGQSRRTQSGTETPRRRGKKQILVSPAIPDGLAGQDSKSGEQLQNKSGDSLGSQRGSVSSIPLAPGPDSFPGSTTMKEISGTVQHFGVAIAPISQPTTLFPSVIPASQANPPCPSVPMQVRGTSQKTQSGVGAPRRRGKKQVPVLPAVPEGLAGLDPTSKEQSHNKSGDSSGSQKGTVSSLPTAHAPNSFPGPASVQGIGGTLHNSTVEIVHSSQSTPPSLSVAPGSHSSSPCPPVSMQVKGRNQKTQSGVEAPRRRGRKPGSVSAAVPDRTAVQDPKSNKQPQNKSLGNRAIAMRSKRQNDAQKLTNVIQERVGKVHAPDSLADQDPKLTEQKDCSAQNKQPPSSSTTHEAGPPLKSKDEILPTATVAFQTSAVPALGLIKTADVNDVAPVKEVLSEACSSKAKTAESFGIEVGDAPNVIVSSHSLVEVTNDQSSGDKSFSTMSTLETAPPGFDLPIGKYGNQSGKEGDPEVQELKDPVLDEVLVLKPKVCEPESKITAGSVINMADSRQLVEEDSMIRSNVENICAVPPGFKTSETYSSETRTSESCGSKGGDAPSLPLSGQSMLKEINDQSLEDRTDSTMSSLETAAPGFDLPIHKHENDSGEESEAKAQGDKDPIQEETLLSKPMVCEPESKITISSVENVADSGHLIEENSIKQGNMEVICTVSPGFRTSETCSSETKMGESFRSEYGDAPTVPKSSQSIIEVKDHCADDKTNATSSILETAGPDFNLPIDKHANQSGEHGPKELEDRDPVLDKALVLRPNIYKSENQSPAGSVVNMADSRQTIEENSIMDSNMEVVRTVSPRFTASEACPSEPNVGKSFGTEGGDAPSLPVSSQSLVEVTNNNLEDSTMSTLETSAQGLDLPIDKPENQSGEEGDAKAGEVKDPVLEEILVSRQTIEENSIMDSNMEVVHTVSPRFIASEACPSEPSIGKSFGTEGGDAPSLPVSSQSLVEVTNNNLEDSTMSTLETSAQGLDLPIDKPENQSGEEGDAKAGEVKDPVLEEILVSRQTIEENSIMDSDMEVVRTVSPRFTASEACPSEPNIGKSFGTEGGDAPSLPVSSQSLVEVTNNNLEDSTLSTLETSAQGLDLPIDKPENQSGEEGDAKAGEVKDPVLEEILVSKLKDVEPESKITTLNVENTADSGQINEENSNTMENICAVPPGFKTSETCSSETNIGKSFGAEGGDAPSLPVSSQSLVDMANNNLEDSTVSTLETSAQGLDLPIDKPENQSGEEGDAKAHEVKDPVLDEILVSKLKDVEPESKITTLNVENIADSGQINEENSNTMNICAVPPGFKTSETCSSETNIGKSFETEGGDAPSLPVSSQSLVDMANNNLEDLTVSTLETSAQGFDLPIDKPENQSGEEGDAKAQEVKDPVLDEILVSKLKDVEPESKITTLNVENTADSGQINEENSNTMENICAVPPGFKTSETCSSETKINDCLGSAGEDALSLPISYQSVVEEIDDQSSGGKTCSAMSTLETAAPDFDLPINEYENQSGEKGDAKAVEVKDPVLDGALVSKPTVCGPENKITAGSGEEVDAKAVEVKDPVQDEALVSKPTVCEPESNITAGSVENLADSRQLIGEDSTAGSNIEVICPVRLDGHRKDVPCEKQLSPDNASTGFCAGVSSIQAGSPSASKGAVESPGMSENNSGNVAEPLVKESPKSSALKVRSIEGTEIFVKGDDVGDVSGHPVPVDPDHSLDVVFRPEDKPGMPTGESTECSSEAISESPGVTPVVAASDYGIATLHDDPSDKGNLEAPCSGSEDKRDPVLESVHSITPESCNAEPVPKEHEVQLSTGVESTEGDCDEACNMEVDPVESTL
ncbi:hypothetical protein L1049_016535 [Liquidambar formosana]|uniref:Chromatin structure-remodeling complex protein SYD-like n=1 Tax=Liquidambar formosana TaxID=63359 RepID=A0AAP0S1J1_LIQFO